MNPTSMKSDLRSELASAAQALERPSAFQELIPYKAEIQNLRSKGASFILIAQLLQKHSMNISREKVRRFYYSEINNAPIQRKKSKRRRKAKPTGTLPTAAKSKTVAMPARTERGPRIARIEEL